MPGSHVRESPVSGMIARPPGAMKREAGASRADVAALRIAGHDDGGTLPRGPGRLRPQAEWSIVDLSGRPPASPARWQARSGSRFNGGDLQLRVRSGASRGARPRVSHQLRPETCPGDTVGRGSGLRESFNGDFDYALWERNRQRRCSQRPHGPCPRVTTRSGKE